MLQSIYLGEGMQLNNANGGLCEREFLQEKFVNVAEHGFVDFGVTLGKVVVFPKCLSDRSQFGGSCVKCFRKAKEYVQKQDAIL